jgi:hypothetical protein
MPNPGFENAPTFVAEQTGANWIDGSAAGSAVDTYKWRFRLYNGATGSCRIDDSEKDTGSYSIKLTAATIVDGSSIALVGTTPQTAIGANESTSAYLIPIEASTKYKIRFRIKTSSITSALSKGAKLYWYTFNGTTYTASGSNASFITGTNGWTTVEIYFTSGSTSNGLAFQCRIDGETGTAWFDNITVEKTTVKKIGGIVKDDVKTIRGVDLASVKSINGLVIT